MKHPNIIIPKGLKPTKKETEAAKILSVHFVTTVQFLIPINEYMQKTPDFLIDNQTFELKTPTSSKTRKIEDLIRRASLQANNIVIDTRYTRIADSKMIKICASEAVALGTSIRIFLILKSKKVIELPK